MGRTFGLLLLIGLGWLILRQILRATDPNRGVARQSPPPRFEKTVRCARCGVHLPIALARQTTDGHVCADTDCESRGDSAPTGAAQPAADRQQ